MRGINDLERGARRAPRKETVQLLAAAPCQPRRGREHAETGTGMPATSTARLAHAACR
jgi:hypothetical protein